MAKGYIYLLLATFCYGIMGVLIRSLGGQFTPLAQVSIRYLLTAIVAYLVLRSRHISIKLISPCDLPLLIAVCMFAYGFTNVFFTLAALNTTLSTTFFLTSTYAILAPFIAAFLLKEKITAKLITSMILVFIGSYFLFNPTGGKIIGSLFALFCALLFAFYMVGRRILKNYSAELIIFFSTVMGAISVGIVSFILEKSFYFGTSGISLSTVSPFGWFIMFLFVLDTYATWFFVNKGFETVPAGKGSIILLGESIWGTMFGFLFYGEPLTMTIIFGIILILSGLILTLSKSR